MAEETLKTSEVPKEEVMDVCDVTSAEKPTTETEKVAVPVPEETPEKSTVVIAAEESVSETEKSKEVKSEEKAEKTTISQSVSFKEESNKVSDLEDPEKKALDELKQLIQKVLNNHEFTFPPPPKEEEPKPTITEEKTEPESKPEAVEEKKSEPAKEEEKSETIETNEDEGKKTAPPPPPETVVVTETVSETVVVDDDGAKTVEAIEETIVAVQTTPVCEAQTETVPQISTQEDESSKSIPEKNQPPEEVFIWGIPLLSDERSDVILLKFLRARDFKVKEAFNMIKNTVRWRKEFGIDALLEEDLGNDLEKVVFMQGFDKEGHPVCYNVYGEFQKKELYSKTFSDEEKRQKFLQWRIQFLEKSIRNLDLTPGGISTIVQINDLKNSPGPGKWELRQATNQALSLLQDNYPEFVAKQIFINVPWWYLAFYRMISPFLTQRTKSKFVVAGSSKSAETLFKYISPEQVPVQYGGLSKEGDKEFSCSDPVTEITLKPSCKQTVEFQISENCVLVWEVRVVGWDVSYGAEFVPDAEFGYTVIVQKTRKISSSSDEPFVCNNFKIGEPGKVILTIDNPSSKKKKLLYRSKTKPSFD